LHRAIPETRAGTRGRIAAITKITQTAFLRESRFLCCAAAFLPAHCQTLGFASQRVLWYNNRI
uniref:hypothetical protein n=1 Tax=Gemmiger sp. TaxID=2049027 RepID=UPI003FEFF68B